MVKFTGQSQTLAINSGSSGTNFCLTGVDYDLDVDVYSVPCAGGAHKEQVAGQDNSTATLNWAVDSQALDNILGAGGTFLRGATATDYVHNPEGGGASNPTITSTKITIGRSTVGIPVEGFVNGTTVVHFDNITFGALTA